MMTGAMPSTPTAGMETLMGITPIECYLKKEAMAAGMRIINNGHWKARRGETLSKYAHTRLIETWRTNLEGPDTLQDKLNIKVKLKADFTTEILEREAIDKNNTKPMPRKRK